MLNEVGRGLPATFTTKLTMILVLLVVGILWIDCIVK
jgi:hypothetical protein